MTQMSKRMEVSGLSRIVADNVRQLVAHNGQSVTAWCNSHDLVQTTISRLLRGQLNPTTAILEDIAAAAGIQPWQLLVPDLDPRNLPVLRSPSGPEADFYRRIAEMLHQLPK